MQILAVQVPTSYVQESPRTRVSKRVPNQKVVIFPILACLAWKRLQIGTCMLLIITSIDDVLFSSINTDDFEW